MAEGKNKVIWYTNWGKSFLKLTDEEAGKLIKHFSSYVLDQSPEAPDRLTELLFDPIEDSLKRDLKSWEQKRQVNVKNGKKGGRPKTQITQTVKKEPNGLIDNPEKGVKDKVNVKGKDNVNETVNVINSIEERKLKFSSTLEPYLQKYGRPLLKDFSEYWTEPNKSNTKFRQELEKTWSLERRLSNWAKNDNKFNSNGTSQKSTSGGTRNTNSQVQEYDEYYDTPES